MYNKYFLLSLQDRPEKLAEGLFFLSVFKSNTNKFYIQRCRTQTILSYNKQINDTIGQLSKIYFYI